MNKYGGDLVRVMKHKAVAPRDDGTRKGAVGEAVGRDKHGWAGWCEPYIDETQNVGVIAQVEEEVVP